MVGVPRSKGCRICVQRRVKCDQTRPTCNNCRKGNRPCPGYGHDLKFRDESARLRQKFTHDDTAVVAFRNGKSTPVGDTDAWPDLMDAYNSDVSAKYRDQLAKTGDDTLLSDEVLTEILENQAFPAGEAGEHLLNAYMNQNKEMFRQTSPMDVFAVNSRVATFMKDVYSPDVFQEQLLALFASHLAPPGYAVQVPKRMQYYSRWLARIPPTTGNNALLDNAVRAVGLAHFGRLRQSDAMVHQSRSYYGKALHLLNSSILDRRQGMSGETLSATIFLSFYEMLASPSESWIRHAGGAGALMKMRGPAAHRYGIAREVFMAYRFTIIIQSFQTDSYCFLDTPEWDELAKQIRSDILASKAIPEDRLELFELAEEFFERMVRVPAIVHEAKNIPTMWREKGFSNSTLFVNDLTARAKERRAQFKTIFAKMRTALQKSGLQSTTIVTQDPIFPTAYEYPNVFLGSTTTGYWTVLIVLNLVLTGLEENTAPENVDLYRMENHDAAVMSCRSVSYMLGSSFLGPFFVVFALRMALYTFHSKSPEWQWVVRKLHEISESHMKMASHLPGWVAHGYQFHGPGQINVKATNGGVTELEIVPETADVVSQLGEHLNVAELI